eukprot:UC1_evm1s852
MSYPAATHSRFFMLACFYLVICAQQCHFVRGLRLEFDPAFSPPDSSAADISTKMDLYYAYNRPAMSKTKRPLKVRVFDDNGNIVTTGPDSTIDIRLSWQMPGLSNAAGAEEAAALADIAATDHSSVVTADLANSFLIVKGENDYGMDLTDYHETRTVNGVGVFDCPMGILPTVWLSNTTTAAPYDGSATTMSDAGL